MKTLKKIVYRLAFLSAGLLLNICYANDSTPKFDCVLTDQVSQGDVPGPAKDNFKVSTPMVYLVCTTEQIKKGQQLKSIWVAADTNNVAPPDYKIDEKSIDINEDLTKEQVYKAKFSLSKPDKGWPVGRYHVDLYVDGNLLQSYKFTIQ